MKGKTEGWKEAFLHKVKGLSGETYKGLKLQGKPSREQTLVCPLVHLQWLEHRNTLLSISISIEKLKHILTLQALSCHGREM